MKGQANHHQVHKMQIHKLLSIAGVLEIAQIARMVDIKADNLDTVLTQMQKAGKLLRRGNRIATDETAMAAASPVMIAAMWVFADFIRHTEYYTAGEFPAVLCFFAEGTEYEIIPLEIGRESMIAKAVSQTEDPPLRLLLVQDREQIGKQKIPGTAAYCIVGDNGTVQYFKET